MSERLKITICPANGAFGTALAIPFAASGHDVTLLFRDEEKSRAFSRTRSIERLPGIIIPNEIEFTSDKERAIKDANLLVMATPISTLRSYFSVEVLPLVREETDILCVTKGLEKDTYRRASEIIEELDSGVCARTAVISGPNLAYEIASGLPFATVIASQNPEVLDGMVTAFRGSMGRVYLSNDVAGVELAGAFKNIIAIAAGAVDGLKMGENARAALITRGGVEIKKLAMKMGAREKTLEGLASIGDLWLTCTSNQSRNHWFGERIGKGMSVVELLATQITFEGYGTTRVAYELAMKYGIDMPITGVVYEVLYEGLNVQEAMLKLMGRNPVYEDGTPFEFSRQLTA